MTAAAISDLVPWREVALPASPWESFWAFNPTILRVPDDADSTHAGSWLCNLRCASYHLPGSGAQRNSTESPGAVARRIENRNLVAVLDPSTWEAIQTYELHDRVPPYRRSAAHVLGYEDLRLAYTKADGLIATATTMQCSSDGTLEIAVLEIDDDLEVTSVQPLRGDWSGRHQKNWMPYVGDDTAELRLLYSVEEGGVHDRGGRLVPLHGRKYEIAKAIIAPVPTAGGRRSQAGLPMASFQNGSMTVQIMAGRSRVAPPRQTQLTLRGGTQLVSIGGDLYLGLAHGCRLTAERKFYWHHAVIVSGTGRLQACSRPVKLAPDHGIEFAAGLAREPGSDCAVVTFGVDDDFAILAETELSALVDLALTGDRFL